MITIKKNELQTTLLGLKAVMPKIHKQTGFWAIKIAKNLEEQLALFNQDKRSLISQYCTKDENGKPVIKAVENGMERYDIPTEHITEFTEVLTNLSKEEVKIDQSLKTPGEIDQDLVNQSNPITSAEYYAIYELVNMD